MGGNRKDSSLSADENSGSNNVDVVGGEKPSNKAEIDLKEQISVLEEKLLRVFADSENSRKRAEKEKEDLAKYSVSKFAKDILSIRDNLKLALSNCQQAESSPIIDGIKMTLGEMDRILGMYDIRIIESENRKFDPNIHQAMLEIEDNSRDAGTIVEVLQDGFTIHNRLLRPVLVTTSKKH
ncbi:MAG: nucleotide exchange factor GrpE [Holosporales bacterium]|jgi:molecular chaperone GrpE|nr:nucleotide exchange factor GrpE [Holosporales bacterium]